MLVPWRGDLIDGRFVRAARSDGEIVRDSPADFRERVAVYPTCGEHVDAAVSAARAAGPVWAARPLVERAAALERLRESLAGRSEDLAWVLGVEVGKPTWEAEAEVEAMIHKVGVTLRDAAAEIAPRTVADLPGGARGEVRWRPLGVAAVIGPFNFPGHLVHGQAVPALLAGNTVVIKPSELAPAVGQTYAEIAEGAGLPPGVLNVVQGAGAAGARLVAHPDVDAVLFTGSWPTGRRILEATLDQPGKLVALELGGKNAAVVLRDADLDLAAYEVAQGAYATCGQRCTATSRLVVERAVAEPLIDRVARLARDLRVGHPLDADVFMGPLISEPARRRFLAALAAARDAVEPIVPGGAADVGRPGAYLRPSLHRVVRRDAADPYQRDELFGPDLAVHVVEDLDEALAVERATPYGLVAALFSRGDAAWERFSREARAGVLHRNRATVGASSRLPFSGLGRSGNHRPGGVLMIRSCADPQALLEGDGRLEPERLPPGLPRPNGAGEAGP